MPRPKKTAAPSGNDNDGPAASGANSAYDAPPAPAPVVSCLRGGPAHFAWVKHPDYPDGPDLDPQFGDRTPEFVEWLAKRQQQQ